MSSPSKGPVEVSRNWPCPVCKTVFTATGPSEEAATAKLTVKRTNRIQQRHKDQKHAFGPHTQIRKPVIPEVSADIPMDQRGWSCPMPRCNMGLGSMSSRWARDQAIERHRKPCHPEVTRAEWYHKRWKQWKSPKQISLQQSKVQLAITVRTKKLAAKDMSPNGHSLLQFLPDWDSWKPTESSKKRDYFTCVKCLKVDCKTWSSACRGSRHKWSSAHFLAETP